MREDIAIPTAPEELTTHWLAKTLKGAGILAGNTAVASFTVHPVTDASMAGEIVRISLDYDGQIEQAPSSIIAKFPHPDVTIRDLYKPFYVQEVQIYQNLHEAIKLPKPHCYYSHIDIESGQFILLLEDLSHLRREDLVIGCNAQDAETVLIHFAQHHSQWWIDPRLEEIDYLRWDRNVDSQTISTNQDLWAKFADKVTTWLPDYFLPATFLKTGDTAVCQQQGLEAYMANIPFTFIHNDAHLDNLMFAQTHNDPPLTVIDWQLCRRGAGVHDIALFILRSMTIRSRRAHENQLLKTYHATLVAHGVVDYNFQQCWQDYRHAFFEIFLRTIFVVNVMDLTSPIKKARLQSWLSRLASFAEDHHVDDFFH